jgi:NADH pyrophosphatase NudC (nudix superfamily)
MFNFCPICQSENINTQELPLIHCISCGFTYFHNCASAVAGIIICDNQILFNIRASQPARGCLDLPGGFVDYEEGLEEALTREVKEELNIDIKQWKYLSSHPNTYEHENVIYKTIDSIFSCHLQNKPAITVQAKEVSDFVWVDLNEIDIEKIGFKSIQTAITLYLEENTPK